MLLSSSKHQGSGEKGIPCCTTLLLHAQCTRRVSTLPWTPHSAAWCGQLAMLYADQEQNLTANGGYFLCSVTHLALFISHMQLFNSTLSFRLSLCGWCNSRSEPGSKLSHAGNPPGNRGNTRLGLATGSADVQHCLF